MANYFDVIIVGAGPAGLQCAYHLKNTNLSVLVIEKNEVVGEKACGGGLTFFVSGSLYIPQNKVRIFKEEYFFLKNNYHRIKLANYLRTISRLELGKYQLEKIKNFSNIKLLKGTNVLKVEKNKVITNRGTFNFKYLVGADGSSSVVRKYLGLKNKFCMALYYEVPVITKNVIWKLNPKKLKSGYIWSFPHKDHTNIGVFFNPFYVSRKTALDLLWSHLKSNNYDISKLKLKGDPINYFYSGCIFDNFFLAGDAGGFASKKTGEGISFALRSGEFVAQKIKNSGSSDRDLDKILKIKRRQEMLVNFHEKFPFFSNFFIKVYLLFLKNKNFQRYFGI